MYAFSRVVAFVCALSFAVPTLPAQESLMSRVKNYFSPAAMQKATDFLHKHPWLVAAGAVALTCSAVYAFMKLSSQTSQALQSKPQQILQSNNVQQQAYQAPQEYVDQEDVLRAYATKRVEQNKRPLNSFSEINIHFAVTIILLDECMRSCKAQGLPEYEARKKLHTIMERRDFDDILTVFRWINIENVRCPVIVLGLRRFLKDRLFSFSYTFMEHMFWKLTVQKALDVVEPAQQNMPAHMHYELMTGHND